MNIRIGTWLEKNHEIPGEDFLANWQTAHWQESCHDIEVFLAQDSHASSSFPKGIYSEQISRHSVLKNIHNELSSHWQEQWARIHKDFFLSCGLKVQVISEEETLQHLQGWLQEWLNFWASYQALQRYCATNYGDDEIDVVVLARPEFRWSLDEKSIGKLYQKVCRLEPSTPERTSGYFWPPLNTSNQLIVQYEGSQIQMIMGQELTIRQLFNPKNIRLYFCEHHQPLHSAMIFDTNPISCISRLLNIEWTPLSQFEI